MTLKQLLSKAGLLKEVANYEYFPDENHIEGLNLWPSQQLNELWVYRFIIHHFSHLLSPKNSLLISSVFGAKANISNSKSKIKLFYSGENLDRFPVYKNYCKGIADIALGFDYLEDDFYQRFPVWITYFLAPFADKRIIREQVENFVYKDSPPFANRKFASLVCSHDSNGIRTKLFNKLTNIDKVYSGGKYLNNTSDLQLKFNNDKRSFISQYKFNICTENTDKAGYVTEKVFEAIWSNTVPIYWGSNNNPEPEILNKEAILLYDKNNLSSLIKVVEELHHHPKTYAEFINQPRFQPHAAEYIEELFNGFYTKLKRHLTSN